MFTAISHSGVWVFDHDEALDFYVGKLGLEVVNDVQLDVMRWLTVGVPGQPDRQIILMLTEPPSVPAEQRERLRETIALGLGPAFILHTDDCRAEHARLAALGVEFTQEPTERFYGVDCGLRDPFGNPIRLTQPAEQWSPPPARWEPAGAAER